MSMYCDRCGEDGGLRWHCEKCGAEFCHDCGTERELQSGFCRQCSATPSASTSVPSLPPKPRFLTDAEWIAIDVLQKFHGVAGPDVSIHQTLTASALVKLIERVNESEAAMRIAIPVVYAAAEIVHLRLRHGCGNGDPEAALVKSVDQWLAHEQATRAPAERI